MITPNSAFYSYALVRCADAKRDEHLNVGVVVVDQEGKTVLWRFDKDLKRVAAAFPTLPVQHVRSALGEAGEAFERMVMSDGIRSLEDAGTQWQNLLRVSPVRSIRAEDAGAALLQTFMRYVAPPKDPLSADAVDRPPRTTTYTSGALVRSMKVRLKRRGLLEWEHYEVDAQIQGYTRDQRPVPVWYPIKVKDSKLFDAFEASDAARQTAWDAARLMSQKSQETLRDEGRYSVTVTIRGRGRKSELPYELAALLQEEGAVNGYRPTVDVIRDVDELDRVAKDLGEVGPTDLFEDMEN